MDNITAIKSDKEEEKPVMEEIIKKKNQQLLICKFILPFCFYLLR